MGHCKHYIEVVKGNEVNLFLKASSLYSYSVSLLPVVNFCPHMHAQYIDQSIIK